ncbi:hypothetical protein [Clostridium rectalis]|uniref:hypothetical protein n=1 Tax=Clostridium rectalis TaxID=2040295 RepID=UPI000F62CD5E|nr:hypothetical protein [Clostridium rectalis]
MNINKAIKKQKKSYKRFMLLMSFIFFILPIILIISNNINIFYILYLIIIECLVIIAIMVKKNNEALNFQCDNYKLKITSGLKKDKLNIICSKVEFVHVENIIRKSDKEKDFIIILIACSTFRSKRMIPMNYKFLKNHPYVAFHYNKMKILNPENKYAFSIIKKGKNYKYELLDCIYKSCVYATFTEEAIEKIKDYRACLIRE